MQAIHMPRKTALAIAIAATTAIPAAHAQIEEVVVTAQKRAQSVQDVPISVSAFDANALDTQQIDSFGDLQFNVPNVSFSKGNFTGSNFTIRGIGTLLTATSGDSGVAQHVNDVYLQSPRLFETEYYDMEQVEILRGPQGTLFGRNSTGGAVNLKTAKPNFDGMGADVELQAGNYDHGRIKGAVNVPLSDTVAVRVAGIYLDRGGYSDNLVTGNDIDDREQYSIRGSLRWLASDRTTVDLMASYFDEDSTRTRSQKQFCDQDPSGILGCLPTTLASESINGNATLGQLFASNLVVGALTGIPSLGAFNIFAPVADQNPDDERDVAAFFDPAYESDETLLIGTITHDVNDWLTATAIVSYQETFVSSRMDYNGTGGIAGQATVPTGFCAISPAACAFYGTQDGGPLWFSGVADAGTSLGASGGDFVLDATGAARDLSLAESEQSSIEFRLASSLDGPWNFLVSGYYLDFETETDYVVQASGLDYANTLFGTLGLLGAGVITDPTTAFGNAGTSFFNSETDRFGLESFAVFGEAYYDVSDTVKLTLGLRYSEDEKSIRDRQLPLLAGATTITGLDGSNTYIGANGPVPVADLTELLAASAAAGEYDGDPSTAGNQLFRDASDTFDAVTGRIVLDWAPEVSFTDDTLVYLSYSLGFKSGGLNPPVDAALFGATPGTFDNEEIDAWEIGTKNTLMDGKLQANMNLFYYDYADLQIGKIVNRTSLNENTDAEIYGFEGEFIFAPTENWLFDGNIALINTELGDTQTTDPRDPWQGRADVSVFKDPIGTNNCAVGFGNNAAVSASGIPAAIAGVGGFYLPTGVPLPAFGGATLPATPGVTDSAITSCAAVEGVLASGLFPGYEFFPSGVETNLQGNDLPSTPEMTINLGAQYTHFFGNGMSLMGRVDYYWQDEYYTTAFNRAQDNIDAWDIWNAQVTLTSADETWYVRVFGQNLADENNIVGTYATDPSSGLFTNAFFTEPRLIGATVGANF